MLACCVSAGLGTEVRAQPAPQYQELINQALLEFRYKNWPEARALFRRAHELSPNARTLRGLGVVSYEMRDYVEANRALSAALADTRQPLTAEQRREVSELLTRTRAFVGRFTLEISPADANVDVDGAPLQLEPDGTLLLAFGTHRIEAQRSGFAGETAELSVQGGEQGEVTLALTELGGAAPVATDQEVGEAGESPAEPARPPVRIEAPVHGLRYTWALLSASAVLGGGTLAAWLVGQNKLDDLDSACRTRAAGPDPCVPGAVNTDSVERLQTLSNVGLGLTGAFLATTAVVAYFEWPRERSAASVVVGPSAFAIRGAF